MRRLFLSSMLVVLCVGLFATPLAGQSGPEAAGWYAGDMHVHRSCGGPPEPIANIHGRMDAQNLAVASLLADMGNGEVQDATQDLLRVNGQDDPVSTPGRIVHWDTEWHWDPIFDWAEHKALGGHIVALGLSNAEQVWEEYTYPILDWAHRQNGIAGFAHLQYLGNGFPQALNCCTPLEYPVEVALGTADFISEDVDGNDSAIQAYYRLLNSGFRPGLAAGTDYPCNPSQAVGAPLTYARVAGGVMNYRNWIEAIAQGRTVVARTGHNEFLDLKVDTTAGPGDEVDLSAGGSVDISATWTATGSLDAAVEIIQNGTVIFTQPSTVSADTPVTVNTTANFTRSGWLAARVTGAGGHTLHTAAVFVKVNNAPVRANAADPQFYVDWIDNLLANTASGAAWGDFFINSRDAARSRYQSARALYQQIASEAAGTGPTLTGLAVTPGNGSIGTGSTQQLTATASYSDGSTLDVTGQAAWSSSNTAAASINRTGLAYAINPGTTTITATLDGQSGNTNLTVQVVPLTITTATLGAGTAGVPYSVTLAANGGTTPYTWSITGGALPGGLTLDGASGAISGTPALGGTFNVTVQVADAADPQQTATASFDLTVSDLAGYFTLWAPSAAPTTADSGPDGSVELGVKFQSDVNAQVVGVRFYKSAANTGLHTGSLWTADGTELASAEFQSETASGWQQVMFAEPVTIHAGVTYVASYHTEVGHYSADADYFVHNGLDSPPLHAPINAGVFGYGTDGPTFPTRVWNASNYWVDVVVAPAPPDTTPPAVNAVSPANGANGVDTRSSVTATLSEPIDPSTINSSTVELRDSSNAVVSATVTYNSQTFAIKLIPNIGLQGMTEYTATLKGGAAGIKDTSNNPLASDYTWSFTTGTPPPPMPSQGPGGPVLVLTTSSSPLTMYSAEILRAEGLNLFRTADISELSPAMLSNYHVVIVGAMPLTAGEAATLADWVNGGGTLIALRPDKKLAPVLGLTDANGTLAEAYLAVNTGGGPGAGIVSDTIQFHGVADLYELNGATALATLYGDATTATANPAVTVHNYGAGRAAAFTYDLARSVVYTRQGNPAWAAQARTGQPGPIRASDMFYGASLLDPQPDWVDLNKVAIPQADEQQRLLANMILQLNTAAVPLPRFWYLPRSHKAVVVMTGDDHGALSGSSGGTVPRFDEFIAASPEGCSVDDWECVRGTSYVAVTEALDVVLSEAQLAFYTSQGFEVAPHIDSTPGCSNWTAETLPTFYADQMDFFRQSYPALAGAATHRMHCVSWSDYDSQAKVELQNGIRLDTNYYYWPAEWVQNRPGLFTGSGMPMRFADAGGNLLDIYQAVTQMADEAGQTFPLTIDALLENALGTTGYYGAFTANIHTDEGDVPEADLIIASAQERGVPVISAAQLLTWLDGRNASSFGNLTWNGNTLSFEITAGSGARGLRAMLPKTAGGENLASISFNGTPVAYTVQTIKGMSYAVFAAEQGSYQVVYGSSSAKVSGLSFAPATVAGGGTSTATVTLSIPAPPEGATISLSSGNAAVADVPETVSVTGGQSSATFTVTTVPVAQTTVVSITATFNGSVSADLTVDGIDVAGVSLNPTSVPGRGASTGTVTLAQAAPAGGVLVTLSSSNTEVATVPADVTVAAGNTTAEFTVTTSATAVETSADITATNDGVSQTATLTITVTPTATASTALLSLWEQDIGHTSISRPVTVTNTGSVPYPINIVTITGTNAAEFAQTNDCGPSLAVGASCTFDVRTTPAGEGERVATLTVGNAYHTVTTSLLVKGVQPAPSAHFSVAVLRFPATPVGTTGASLTATLTNTGSLTLAVGAFGFTGPHAADFSQTNNCPATLEYYESCDVTVTYSPTGAGARYASLTLSSNDPLDPVVSVMLRSTGYVPTAQLGPGSLEFGNVQANSTSVAQTLTLTSTSQWPVSVTSVSVIGASASWFTQENNCQPSVAGGGSCTITVRFVPPAIGTRNATLTVKTDAGNFAATLRGTGVKPSATLSPTSIDFGNVQVGTSSAPRTVVLTNTGTGPLAITSVGIAGASASYFAEEHECGATLAAGASCTIDVVFAPPADVTRYATLRVVTTAGTLGVALSGTGAKPSASLSRTAIAFGFVNPGSSSAPEPVVLTNTGTIPLAVPTIEVLGASAPYFQQENNCGTSLAAGGTCTINVVFSATSPTARKALLRIVTAAGTLGVSLSGTGVSPD